MLPNVSSSVLDKVQLPTVSEGQMGPITVQIVRNHFEPLLAIAFLLTFCCFLVIYLVILEWVKKV